MRMSNDARRFLKKMVKAYRRRLKTKAQNPTLFRFNFNQSDKEFQTLKVENLNFILHELKELEMIKEYTDGGFAITSQAIAYYDSTRKAPFIRVVWFLIGVFTEWLLCKGFDEIFSIIGQLIQALKSTA